jgi:fatty acid CoA ligase FadD9
MSADVFEAGFDSRIADLYATDAQFAAAAPVDAISAATDQLSLSLPRLTRTVMEGYAERPALGQRAVDYVTDPATGRTNAELLPRFETVTYGEVWTRIGAIAAALSSDGVKAGDRVAILGFNSVDYVAIDMALAQIGAVSVPMQANLPVAQLLPIVTESEPTVVASSIELLAEAAELAMKADSPSRLVVFDYHPRVDDQRESLETAAAQLSRAEQPIVVETLSDVIRRGTSLPVPEVVSDETALNLLVYTSGSTGTPKGAMWPARLTTNLWRHSSRATWGIQTGHPSIVLSFLPMSHILGRQVVFAALGNGGTVYFTAKSDMSTFLEDLSLVRPTQLDLVPRVWDMLFREFQSRIDRRAPSAAERAQVEAEVMVDMRRNLLGGRYLSAFTTSAPISAELYDWVESLLELHLVEPYGATECQIVLVDGRVLRPPVSDYKLIDVPDLGYFQTDRPHPRGELLVKTADLFPGYYKRAKTTAEVIDSDGYYRTGDIVAEVGPDQLKYLDRRNNVLKLSQGEFVALAKLDAVFSGSPLVRQIYVYGNSTQPYLLAVVVPTEEALDRDELDELRPLISESLQNTAKAAGLQSHEIPRDFLVETTPFTVENGLLTGIRKLARPKLKARYGERLEQLYDDLVRGQADGLRMLQQSSADRPVLETIAQAIDALLGASASALQPNTHFTDLGGDSLSALSFANLVRDIFGVDVPVGVVVSPASDLASIASYIETQRSGDSQRPTFAVVHGRDVAEVAARDLTLDKFIDAATLAAAPTLPRPSTLIRTVLLTGATGFLGRHLALQWLERMNLVGGKVIALVRAKSDEDARARLDKTFDSGDPTLLDRYRNLAADHLEVIAGDKSQANLGLNQQTWQRLAETVDLIVDPAALVNHVLPYSELFGPNVLGTAELIRLAITTKPKPYTFVSTISVGDQIEPSKFTEDADIRVVSPTRKINDSYANGYGNSKWAAEVLLREAHDLCGLPVAVFRCDMILADTTYAGQINVPDMFTRMILSLVATGIAPASFYELDANGNRQRAHYDGLPVEFVAEAIVTLGAQATRFATYHVLNPHNDGIGLDEYVDWLIDAGYPIEHIEDYHEWLQRFDSSLLALPERQRQHSLLPLLQNYQIPEKPINGPMAPTDRFRAAVKEAKIGPDKDIPHVTAGVILKYITDLQLLGLL